MLTHNLGYPRIGANRELKKVTESYWEGKLSRDELLKTGKALRVTNWFLQKAIGLQLIPSNDFSFYDQVLDMTLLIGAIPKRYEGLLQEELVLDRGFPLETYFAMARGKQKNGVDITAMEMTKWFDTNYHY
ncbi:MAG: 5-methyltetrahydropteroyltriglutamate--homocysteine methyltransferase, partial [bacterium]